MNKKLRFLATVAMLSALAMIIMLFDFPLPFLPSFYKIDFSETVILLGGYVLGPVSTVIMEALKVVIKMLFKPTSTAFVGELANFLTGVSFVLPASLIYARRKDAKGLLIGLGVGIISMTLFGCLFNYYVLLPFYATLYKMPLDQLVAMGTAVNGGITSLFTFVTLAVAPFNIIKGVADAVVVGLIYPRLKSLLARQRQN